MEIRINSIEKERNEEKNRFISEIRSKEDIINQMRNEKTGVYAEVPCFFDFFRVFFDVFSFVFFDVFLMFFSLFFSMFFPLFFSMFFSLFFSCFFRVFFVHFSVFYWFFHVFPLFFRWKDLEIPMIDKEQLV